VYGFHAIWLFFLDNYTPVAVDPFSVRLSGRH